MQQQVAVYSGSFDPITLGHVDIIRRGAGLFDRLLVAVGDNPAKRYRFARDRRVAMVEEACRGLDNVGVVAFSGLLVHAVRDLGGTVILRGLRALSDFDTELRYGLANRELSGLETLFLLASAPQMHVSSSLVKEIHDNGGDVAHLVPPCVLEELRR